MPGSGARAAVRAGAPGVPQRTADGGAAVGPAASKRLAQFSLQQSGMHAIGLAVRERSSLSHDQGRVKAGCSRSGSAAL